MSPRVAEFLVGSLNAVDSVSSSILDLAEYDFPMMEERLRMTDDPPPGLEEFSAKIDAADAIVIVSPEYNGGYPGVLKNALDYLRPEYRRKPFGIVTVSAGAMGGATCLAQLRLVALSLGGFPIPSSMPVTRVGDSFDESGNALDPGYEKRAGRFIGELLWYAEAVAGKIQSEKE